MYHARMSTISFMRPTWPRASFLVCSMLAINCSKRIPDEVALAVEANLPVAIQVAADAGKLCPLLKVGAPFQANPIAAPPPPPSPAIGSALGTHKQVVDVLVSCTWLDPRDPNGRTSVGTSFPQLNGKSAVPMRPVTMPEDLARTTCKKDPDNCEQIVVPSRYIANESSADIRITRKTVDGTVEVVVILAP